MHKNIVLINSDDLIFRKQAIENKKFPFLISELCLLCCKNVMKIQIF